MKNTVSSRIDRMKKVAVMKKVAAGDNAVELDDRAIGQTFTNVYVNSKQLITVKGTPITPSDPEGWNRIVRNINEIVRDWVPNPTGVLAQYLGKTLELKSEPGNIVKISDDGNHISYAIGGSSRVLDFRSKIAQRFIEAINKGDFKEVASERNSLQRGRRSQAERPQADRQPATLNPELIGITLQDKGGKGFQYLSLNGNSFDYWTVSNPLNIKNMDSSHPYWNKAVDNLNDPSKTEKVSNPAAAAAAAAAAASTSSSSPSTPEPAPASPSQLVTNVDIILNKINNGSALGGNTLFVNERKIVQDMLSALSQRRGVNPSNLLAQYLVARNKEYLEQSSLANPINFDSFKNDRELMRVHREAIHSVLGTVRQLNDAVKRIGGYDRLLAYITGQGSKGVNKRSSAGDFMNKGISKRAASNGALTNEVAQLLSNFIGRCQSGNWIPENPTGIKNFQQSFMQAYSSGSINNTIDIIKLLKAAFPESASTIGDRSSNLTRSSEALFRDIKEISLNSNAGKAVRNWIDYYSMETQIQALSKQDMLDLSFCLDNAIKQGQPMDLPNVKFLLKDCLKNSAPKFVQAFAGAYSGGGSDSLLKNLILLLSPSGESEEAQSEPQAVRGPSPAITTGPLDASKYKGGTFSEAGYEYIVNPLGNLIFVKNMEKRTEQAIDSTSKYWNAIVSKLPSMKKESSYYSEENKIEKLAKLRRLRVHAQMEEAIQPSAKMERSRVS